MSFRMLTGDQPENAGSRHAGTGLIFVLNAEYLSCFRVLIFTLLQQNSLLDLPVIVISDDEAVLQDPIVKRVADRTRFVSEQDRASFSSILGSKIQDKYKLDWIAKYTFLKWLIFDDYGFDRLFYIDADMVALGPLDDMLEAAEGVELLACPRFPEDLLADGDLEARARAVAEFAGREHDPAEIGLNSGIMVLSGRVLSREFRDGLVELASRKAFPSEQRAIWQHSRDRGLSLRYLGPNYNFKSMVLERIPMARQLDHLREIRILHYIGSAKPWRKAGDTSLANDLWRRFEQEARAFFAPFIDGTAPQPPAAEPQAPQPSPVEPAAQKNESEQGMRTDMGFSSSAYWEERYRGGRNSGSGSSGRLQRYKSRFINDFVAQNGVADVIDFGSGDGSFAAQLDPIRYVGVDVSQTVVDTNAKNAKPGFSFIHVRDLAMQARADLTLSFDVIYHLVEDEVFEKYMWNLFTFAKRFVIVYASNRDEATGSDHVRHRKFTDYVARNMPDWKLAAHIPNPYPFDRANPRQTSFADLFVFRFGGAPVSLSLPPVEDVG